MLVRVDPDQASWEERQHDGDTGKKASLLLGEPSRMLAKTLDPGRPVNFEVQADVSVSEGDLVPKARTVGPSSPPPCVGRQALTPGLAPQTRDKTRSAEPASGCAFKSLGSF